MKKVSLFLTMLVLTSLLLAACGAQPTSTSVPNTNVPMETSTSSMPATEAPTTTMAATTPTSEATSASTPAIPVTGGNQPSQRITNLIGSPVCGMAGDQLGTVKDLVLDFNQSVVTYMIVDANGRSVAVPYSFLIKPRSSGAGTGSGTGTGAGTGNSTSATSTPEAGGTGTLATDTPSAGGTGTLATSTPSTGAAVSTATSTTGTGTGTGNSGTGANAQQNCLTLSAANDIFTKAPAFDKSVMPGIGQSAQDWDTSIMDWWVTSGAPPATSTPAASGSADTTPTATVAPGVQQLQGVVLASDLLGANIALSSQGAGSGTGTGTGSSLSTSTPSAAGSSTAMPDTTATASSGGTGTGLGTGSTGSSQGKIEDVIIEPRIGKLQYVVVSTGADTWIPVPISALGWDAINNQAGLMIDASRLQNAPSFSSSQFPDISMPGWSQQFSTYWQGNGGTAATATP